MDGRCAHVALALTLFCRGICADLELHRRDSSTKFPIADVFCPSLVADDRQCIAFCRFVCDRNSVLVLPCWSYDHCVVLSCHYLRNRDDIPMVQAPVRMAAIGPNSVELAQIRPNVGNFWPKSAQMWSNAGQLRSDVGTNGRNWAKLGRARPHLAGQTRSKPGQNWPPSQTCSKSLIFGPNGAMPGLSRAKLGPI